MASYKHLTDLGIPVEHQMMNEILNNPNETRIDGWKEYEKEYGVLPPFTWDFGGTILPQWLYVQMSAFKEQAFPIVDFNFHKVQFEGEEHSVEEMINLLINDLAWIVTAMEAEYYWDVEEYGWVGKYENMIEPTLKLREIFDEKFSEAMRIIIEIRLYLWW